MSDDPDACLPAPLKDFVFDLHDSARRSMIDSEQGVLYNDTFRDLSQKYFAQSAWPSSDAVAEECGGDALFLALYNELTHRHLHSVARTRPSCRDRLNGWRVYKNLFDMILKADRSDSDLYLLPEWAFDIMHEFVYQFQGFCQYRTTSSDKRKDEDLALLRENESSWAIDQVMYYLHSLMELGAGISNDAIASSGTLAYKHLGVFAAVALSRLECLLADYTACLEYFNGNIIGEHSSGDGVISRVFSAKISLAYHAGIAYLMLNRYKDAINTLDDVCSEIQRATKTNQLNSMIGHDHQQFHKQFDRMLALLAILIKICPSCTISLDGNKDNIGSLVREKYGQQLQKIESGDEGYEDLFGFACPKFIDPAFPDYSKPIPAGFNHQAYNSQIRRFTEEMEKQRPLRSLHSFMKLYTSIGTSKLASFNGCSDDGECISQLLSLKNKMLQREGSDNEIVSALDIHFNADHNMVNIDEAQRQRRFEGFFLTRIAQCADIQKALDTIIVE